MSNIFTVDIEISGTINGDDFTGKGTSIGDRTLGNPSVSITYSRIPIGSNVLSNFIAIINMLSTLLSREIAPARGFLTLTGGDYEFSRSVEGIGASLRSSGSMERLGPNNLRLKSNINGTIAQPENVEIDEWEGVQIPDGPGSVREVMVIPVSLDGKIDKLYVVTSYKFNAAVNSSTHTSAHD